MPRILRGAPKSRGDPSASGDPSMRKSAALRSIGSRLNSSRLGVGFSFDFDPALPSEALRRLGRLLGRNGARRRRRRRPISARRPFPTQSTRFISFIINRNRFESSHSNIHPVLCPSPHPSPPPPPPPPPPLRIQLTTC